MPTSNEYLNKNYRMVLFRDEDSDLIAEAPDLPGCVADGRTPDEAVENLREAMRSWISSRLAAGLAVPEPSGTEEFSGRILVRMPKYLHKRLAEQAREQSSSLNQYLVSILSEGSARAQGWASNFPSNANTIFNVFSSRAASLYKAMCLGRSSALNFLTPQCLMGQSLDIVFQDESALVQQRHQTENRKVLPIRNAPAA